MHADFDFDQTAGPGRRFAPARRPWSQRQPAYLALTPVEERLRVSGESPRDMLLRLAVDDEVSPTLRALILENDRAILGGRP